MSWTWLGLAVLAMIVLAAVSGFRRGFVREVVSLFLVVISIAIVWIINPYVNDFIRSQTPVYQMVHDSCEEFVASQQEKAQSKEISGEKSFIENLQLPGLLRSDMEQNNTSAVYRYLAVDSFGEYVVDYLATTAVNGISFLISYLLATVMIRLITYALELITRLPVIHGANKLAGAALGAVKCILFVWIAFLVLTLLCNTEIGQKGMEMIEGDTFLNFLYNKNIFMQIFMNIFYGN